MHILLHRKTGGLPYVPLSISLSISRSCSARLILREAFIGEGFLLDRGFYQRRAFIGKGRLLERGVY